MKNLNFYIAGYLQEITREWLKFAWFIVFPSGFASFSLLALVFSIEKTFAMEMENLPMWLLCLQIVGRHKQAEFENMNIIEKEQVDLVEWIIESSLLIF